MGGGSVFKINKDGSGYWALKKFSTTNGLSFHYNGVTLSKAYLYGNCSYGGVENKGGVFRIKTNGNNDRVPITSERNVGIGLNNSTEKLEVTGNVKAASYKYSSPKTYYYSVPASAFQSEFSGDNIGTG